jgi:hypothetical protein
MKCVTHNHPTAISPFPGAATGAGGEIRDEGATGRGAKPKAGLVGYSVSHLRIPGHLQPWEQGGVGKPGRIASALDIMLDGPIGAASFNNEFGRPSLCGYFRTFEHENRGYHKPIMLAGGIGAISAGQSHKAALPVGALYVQLGGPGLLIGMGGGAASSMGSGTNVEDLDFDSVQRGNAEIQRRVQEVIDRSTTSAPAGFPMHCPSSPTAHSAARASTCARCRARTAACRRARSGATRRRSATSSRSIRRRWSRSARSVSASAAPSRCSARPPRTAVWSSTIRNSATRPSTSTCR